MSTSYAPPTLICDSREPDPSPWLAFLPPGWRHTRAAIETGDYALACNPGLVVKRKAPGDFLTVVGRDRPRWERELARARNLAGFFVIVEADLAALERMRGGLSWEAIIGSVAAWCRRGTPVLFASNPKHAAILAWRILSQPAEEAARFAARIERARERAETVAELPGAKIVGHHLNSFLSAGAEALTADTPPSAC